MSTATLSAAPGLAFLQPLRRVLWKEFRMLWGLWVALLILGFLAEWFCMTLPSAARYAVAMGGALLVTVLFTVGAASTIFAVEHEENTYELLRLIPARPWPLWWGKLAMVGVMSLCLGVALALLALLFYSGTSRGPIGLEPLYTVALPAIVEAIAWGFCCSLLIRRPLVAALATIFCMSVEVSAVVTLMNSRSAPLLDTGGYSEVWTYRLAFGLALLALDAYLATHWLTDARPLSLGWQGKARTEPRPIESVVAVGAHSRGRMLGRLMWQTWRDSWKSMLLLLVLSLASSALVTLLLMMLDKRSLLVADPSTLFPTACFGWATIATAIYGSGVFGGDQYRTQYRFLAEHAAQPRLVWWSRQLVWGGGLCAVLLMIVIVVVILFVSVSNVFLQQRFQYIQQNVVDIGDFNRGGIFDALLGYTALSRSALHLALGVATGYGAGQLASLVARRSLTAGFLALVLSVCLSLWAAMVVYWELPWYLFLLPLPLMFLSATWLRVPSWLIDRGRWTNWLAPVSAVSVPMAVMLFSVPAVRLNQVPLDTTRDVRWELAQLISPNEPAVTPEIEAASLRLMELAEEISSADLGEEPAGRDLDGPTYSPAQIKRLLALIEPDVQGAAKLLNEQKHFAISPERMSSDAWNPLYGLSGNLLYEAHRKLQENDLEASAEFYLAALRLERLLARGRTYYTDWGPAEQIHERVVRWASAGGQTSEAVLALCKELSTIAPPSAREMGRHQYRKLVAVLEGKRLPDVMQSATATYPPFHLAMWANSFSFERERALRSLVYLIRRERAFAEGLDQQLLTTQDSENSAKSRESGEKIRTIFAWLNQVSDLESTGLSNSSVESSRGFATSHLLRIEQRDSSRRLAQELRVVSDQFLLRTALRLQLALIAYHLDQGTYPATLAALVPEYLSVLPKDPYSGEEFRYEPQGVNLPTMLYTWADRKNRVPAGDPFFWSIGARGSRLVPATLNDPSDGSTSSEPQIFKVYQLSPDVSPSSGAKLIFSLPKVKRKAS